MGIEKNIVLHQWGFLVWKSCHRWNTNWLVTWLCAIFLIYLLLLLLYIKILQITCCWDRVCKEDSVCYNTWVVKSERRNIWIRIKSFCHPRVSSVSRSVCMCVCVVCLCGPVCASAHTYTPHFSLCFFFDTEMSLPHQSHIHFKLINLEYISLGSLQQIIFYFIYRHLKESKPVNQGLAIKTNRLRQTFKMFLWSFPPILTTYRNTLMLFFLIIYNQNILSYWKKRLVCMFFIPSDNCYLFSVFSHDLVKKRECLW